MPKTTPKKKPLAKAKPTVKQKHPKPANSPIIREIISIGVIALGLLVLLSLFAGSGAGIIGKIIKDVLLGLFGIGAYILPFLLIIGSVYAFLSREEELKASKFILMSILFLLLISLVHIMGADPYAEYESFFSYLAENYINGSAGNGGLCGTVFGTLFMGLIGKSGSYIVIISSILALMIILTGKSLFGAIKFIYSSVNETLNKYAEEDDEYFDKDPYYDNQDSEITFGKQNGDKDVKTFIINSDVSKQEICTDNTEPIHFANTEMTGRGANQTPLYNNGRINRLDILPDDEIEKIRKDNEQIQIKFAGIKEHGEEHPSDLDKISAPEHNKSEASGEHEIGDGILDISEYKANMTYRSSLKKNDTPPQKKVGYIKPPIDLLNDPPDLINVNSRATILENSKKLENTLKSFGVEAKVVAVSQGPAVTRYELAPGQGVKVSKISGLADDLALNLAAVGIRIEAPIPGKSVVGIELPNKEVMPVYLKEVLDDDEFKNFPSKLAVALGKDIAGNTVIADIAKMPHLLVAGATGSGKSVCINTIITSLLYNSSPDEIKLLMIDPKVVELSIYNGIPHLLIPVVTDPKKAAGALNWGVQEMIARYKLFAEANVRDLKGYNSVLKERDEEILPQIVIIIDELSDLMMVAPGEVEDSICRLAQMARAAGIYLIIATQRPSVDVITGLIKANIPSRLAFAVSSSIDSRTILDMSGAEKLLGKGDMLFCPVGLNKPQRVQGAFISDKEVERIVDFLKVSAGKEYDQEMIEKITAPKGMGDFDGESDEFFDEAVEFVIMKEKASASMLQRQFRIGYNRAARLIEEMEAKGVVGPEDGSKPRKVLRGYYRDED